MSLDAIKELNKKIISIEELDITQRGIKTIAVLNECAAEFHEKYKIMLEDNEYDNPGLLIREIETLNSDIFYLWMNEQPNFRKAKSRLVGLQLLYKNCSLGESIAPGDYFVQYLLEYVSALVVCRVADKPDLGDVIVVPTEWSKLVTKYEKEIIVMSRDFELAAEELLFLFLLKRLKKSRGGVFNSGKKHQAQVREFMIKRLMELIHKNFPSTSLTTNLLANVALDISGVFFEPMKHSDACRVAREVVAACKRNQDFLELKVADLFSSD